MPIAYDGGCFIITRSNLPAEAQLCERLSFDVVFLPEHHFDGICAFTDPLAFAFANAHPEAVREVDREMTALAPEYIAIEPRQSFRPESAWPGFSIWPNKSPNMASFDGRWAHKRSKP